MVFCEHELAFRYVWLPHGSSPPTTCPIDPLHTIRPGSVALDCNVDVSNTWSATDSTHYGGFLEADTTSQVVTITLRDRTKVPNLRYTIVKHINGTHPLHIQPTAGQSLNGIVDETITSTVADEVLVFRSTLDGGWYQMATFIHHVQQKHLLPYSPPASGSGEKLFFTDENNTERTITSSSFISIHSYNFDGLSILPAGKYKFQFSLLRKTGTGELKIDLNGQECVSGISMKINQDVVSGHDVFVVPNPVSNPCLVLSLRKSASKSPKITWSRMTIEAV